MRSSRSIIAFNQRILVALQFLSPRKKLKREMGKFLIFVITVLFQNNRSFANTTSEIEIAGDESEFVLALYLKDLYEDESGYAGAGSGLLFAENGQPLKETGVRIYFTDQESRTEFEKNIVPYTYPERFQKIAGNLHFCITSLKTETRKKFLCSRIRFRKHSGLGNEC